MGVDAGDCPQLASVAAGLGSGDPPKVLEAAFRLEGGGVPMLMSVLVHPFLLRSMNISCCVDHASEVTIQGLSALACMNI